MCDAAVLTPPRTRVSATLCAICSRLTVVVHSAREHSSFAVRSQRNGGRVRVARASASVSATRSQLTGQASVCVRVRLRRVRAQTCERLHLHRSAKGAHVLQGAHVLARARARSVRTRSQLTAHASVCVRVSLRRVLKSQPQHSQPCSNQPLPPLSPCLHSLRSARTHTHVFLPPSVPLPLTLFPSPSLLPSV